MVGLILQQRWKRQQCHERGNHQSIQNRYGTGSDDASDGHLIICLLRSRLRNERTARDLRGSSQTIDAKDSKLSRIGMNEPRSTRTLLTREVWSVYLTIPSIVTWHKPWCPSERRLA